MHLLVPYGGKTQGFRAHRNGWGRPDPPCNCPRRARSCNIHHVVGLPYSRCTALPAKRLIVRAFESSRRLTWRALGQQALGVGAEIIVIAGFVVLGYFEHRQHAVAPVDQGVSFLAPYRKASPPPSQERVSYVGLGGAPGALRGARETPTDRGTRPVPLLRDGSGMVHDPSAPQPESESPRPMTEIEVDSTAALDPTAVGPEYPTDLMEQGIQGVVYAQFVVDSTGYADTLTMQVLEKVHPQFVAAVRKALPQMHYKPALFAGKRVPQLVQQAFVFRIQPAGRATPDTSGSPAPASPATPRLCAL